MPITYQDIINQGILDELATVYRNSTSADLLLTAIGFPTPMRPIFPDSGNPMEFWAEVCQQIQHGVIQGGFEILVDAAARNYPGNPVFNRATGAGGVVSAPASGGPMPTSGVASPTPGVSASPLTLKIFLCHSIGDKSVVRDVYMKLKNDGFKPWLDEEDLLPGQNWNLEIKKAVRNSGVVMVFLSNDSVSKRGYVQKEVKMALDVADEQPEGSIFIIPLKLEECGIPDRLSHCQYMSYFGDRDSAYEKLKRTLEAKIAELSANP